MYEEYSIQDYESDFKIGEYENLCELNMLAVKLEQLTETEQVLAAAYCHANSIQTALGMLNICEQLDELSYLQLDYAWGSREECLGQLVAEQIGLEAELEKIQLANNIDILAYFDYERYGRDIALDSGYF
jgi:antirestriction protein